MRYAYLISQISGIVQDSSYTDAIIGDFINEAILKVATGDTIPGRYEKTPPLPDLYATADIRVGTEETPGELPPVISAPQPVKATGPGVANLPFDYNRDLIMVVNSNDEVIPIESSHIKFLKQYPEENNGDIFKVSVVGSRLLYRDIPSASETLTVHYYRKPDRLVDPEDEPFEIPEHLQRKLIINQACKEIFDEIEDGIEDPKTNTMHHESLYQKGLLDLDIWAAAEKEPDYIDDQTEYCK